MTYLDREDRRADAVRKSYYARFDRVVGTLPPGKSARADLLSSHMDNDGVWHLHDLSGTLIAKVRDPDSPEPERKAAPAPPAPAGMTKAQLTQLRNCATNIQALDKFLAEWFEEVIPWIRNINESLAALEKREVIDQELVSEFTDVCARIDDIEARGFRYVGRYQGAASYKRGDVVTSGDALWHAVADVKVGERPTAAAHKWIRMLHGGEG